MLARLGSISASPVLVGGNAKCKNCFGEQTGSIFCKLKHKLTQQLYPWVFTLEKWKLNFLEKNLCPSVPCCPKLETNPDVFQEVSGWTVWSTHIRELLLDSNEGWSLDTCATRKTQRHTSGWKTVALKGSGLFDSIDMTSLKGKTGVVGSITLCPGCEVEGRWDYRGTQEGTFLGGGGGDGTVLYPDCDGDTVSLSMCWSA